MTTFLACGVALALALPAAAGKGKKDTGEGQIAHMVFFTLKDNTPEGRQKLVDACKKYLTKHDGAVYFAAGPRGAGFDRPVNDQNFDVALLIVFKDKAAHDKYQDHARHKKFIAENKDTWKTVRVFDAVLPK